MGLNKALGWAVGAASSVGSASPWAGAGALQVVMPFVFRLAVTTIIFLLIFWEIGFRSILVVAAKWATHELRIQSSVRKSENEITV